MEDENEETSDDTAEPVSDDEFSDDVVVETVNDDLREDEASDDAIGVLTARIASLEAENSRLKTANWELMNSNGTPAPEPSEESDDDHDPITIDGLFGKD